MRVLSIPVGIAAAPAIAGPRVQLAVGTKLQLPAVVIALPWMRHLQDGIRARLVGGLGGRGVVADDPDVAGRIREVDVEAAVGRVVGMKRDAEQSPLASS